MPSASASRAASCIGAPRSPPLIRTALLGPALSSNPCPSGPRQLMRSPDRMSRSWAVPAPTALSTTSMRSPSTPYTEKGRRSNGPGLQPRLTNWPARTEEAISGAVIDRTHMPRATSRLAVISALSRNTLSPLHDRSHLHLLGCRGRGFEQRGRGVKRGQAGNAALDCGASDLEAVLENRPTGHPAVCVDVRHGVDDQVDLAACDDVEDRWALLADFGHHLWREAGALQRSRGAVRGDKPASHLDQARDDREDLGFVDVGDRQQHGAAAPDLD